MLAIAAVVVALIVAGVAVGPDTALPPGVRVGTPGARMFPRIPAPPPDARALLRALGVGSVVWYASALAIAPLWWLAARMPLGPHRAWRALGVQLGAVAALVGAVVLARYGLTYRGAPSAPPLGAFVPVALMGTALPLLAVAAVANAAEAWRRAVRGALEAQRLRAELAESRLVAVTSQLQPHFLFNTLQGISTLIHRDPVAADAMLAKLSDLLRDILRRSRSALVPLGDELRMTETYLELARLRFGDRLRVTIDVDDAVRGVAVPMLLLQPLVENALKHGVGRRAAGGHVGIAARRDGDRVCIAVWDDGTVLDAAAHDGTGLANTRERLRHAFGDEQSLALRERAGGGVEATVRVPLRTA
ncbi:MAG: histidine kinase [Gemmatirosa sp.]|nr:histidine kinase [Gemmatirosa sp.]